MKKHSKKQVMGLDVGDSQSQVCVLDEASGEVVARRSIATAKEEMFSYFTTLRPSLIILEVGTHSPWLSRLLEDLGHEVIVANARELRLIYSSKHKNDRADAEKLARLGRVDKTLLHPVTHRSETQQADLAVIRAREALLKTRQQLVNHIRGVLKACGVKPPKVYPAGFHKKVLLCIPPNLEPALLPLVAALKSVQQQIRALDKRILELAKTHYPKTALLTQIKGVGSLIALTFVLTLADPNRFKTSRSVGAYLGLTPGQDQSGSRDPKQHITKQGDSLLRRYLIQGANTIVGPFGEDSDLRRFALERLEQRGKSARKSLLIAVARKLSILLHRLWTTGEVYEPLFSSQAKSQAQEVRLAA